MPKKKQASGGARIAREGKSLIWVTPTDEEKSTIRVAAAHVGLGMSRFILQAGLEEARKVLARVK